MIKLFKYLYKLLFKKIVVTEVTDTNFQVPRKRNLTPEEVEVKLNVSKGLRLFHYENDISIWALNKKSADRKYNNILKAAKIANE